MPPYNVQAPVAETLVERRLTVRLVSYWERLRGARAMPSEKDIEPDDLADLWDHCFVAQLNTKTIDNYNYRYVGVRLHDAFQSDFSAREKADRISAVPAGFTEHMSNYMQVLETRKPLIEEGEFINSKGDTVRYRQCILPLGNAENVTALLGGMRYRVLPKDGNTNS